jgi:hypothetical protein
MVDQKYRDHNLMMYANGDSNTYGAEVKTNERFSDIVARTLKYQLVNHAIPGGSNQSIIRTTMEYLQNHTPDFVLIGWTTWEREEWLYQGKYYNINLSCYDFLHPDLRVKYKNWVSQQDCDSTDEKSVFWHAQIWKLHQLLKSKNIPHLFFNCFYNFFHISELEKKNWGSNFLGPYDNESSYYWYLNNLGFGAKDYHFGADGHAMWADKLINYIKENELL